jgi:hypothetical protein
MKRQEVGENRFYHNDTKWYRGVSYLTDKVVALTGDDKFLLNWKKSFTKSLENGEEGFNLWMEGNADFGTLGHIGYDMYLKGEFTQRFVENEIFEFASKYRLSEAAKLAAANKMIKNTYSLRQFNIDHELDVLACEQMFKSEMLNTATPCDILGRGKFQTKKGGSKQDSYLFGNIKTGENAARNPHHKWQCLIELLCGLETVGKAIVQNVPICSGTIFPKDFRGDKPTFDFIPYWFVGFKDETYKVNIYQMDDKGADILDNNGEKIVSHEEEFTRSVPVITSYEGEDATPFIETLKSVHSVLSKNNAFAPPFVPVATFEGIMDEKTPFTVKNFFQLQNG